MLRTLHRNLPFPFTKYTVAPAIFHSTYSHFAFPYPVTYPVLPFHCNLIENEKTGAETGTEMINLIGTFSMTATSPGERNVPTIEVTFDLDADGTITITQS